MSRRVALLAFVSLFVTAAHAADVEVQSPWVRGTVEGQKASGAFMTLTSAKGATLVGASVSKKIAGVTEVHEMKMDGDRMLMRAIPRLELPAGKPVALARGGYHIMLMDLKQPLKPGSSIDIELKIENAAKKIETVKVKAAVRDLTDNGGSRHEHHGHHH
ncbi:MAG: copper chaperone PCu(A)C [Rhodocyclaceae bacterium]|nr:copper chaperone PCu(A)C [Rhodocyclaceae bacterium]